MLTAITSGKTAPGATTASWALSLAWDAPVVAVDCDAAGGDMAPGMLAGRVELDRGVLTWARDTRRLSVSEAAMQLPRHSVSIPETEHLWLLPGLQHAEQALAVGSGSWERLGQALEMSSAALGRDAIVDTGRLIPGSCWPLIRLADIVVVTVRPTARSVHHAIGTIDLLRRELGDVRRVAVLVNGQGPYDASEVASRLGLPLLGVLPQDSSAAAVLTEGGRYHPRSLRRTPLMRAAHTVARQLRDGSFSHVRLAEANL